MSGDIELLRLAAKAAGVKGRYVQITATYGEMHVDEGWTHHAFNPSMSDGDALHLAVVLGLSINVYRQHPLQKRPCVEVSGYESRRILSIEFAVDNGESLHAATRRAIVRAAAEIGRAMP